jgi:hypothetical protein
MDGIFPGSNLTQSQLEANEKKNGRKVDKNKN